MLKAGIAFYFVNKACRAYHSQKIDERPSYRVQRPRLNPKNDGSDGLVLYLTYIDRMIAKGHCEIDRNTASKRVLDTSRKSGLYWEVRR